MGPNNSDSLAKAIKLLLENEILKNQLGINAHEDIIKNWECYQNFKNR